MTAMERACEQMRLRMTQQVHAIIKTRARRMLNNELPFCFCEIAAAIAYRVERRQRRNAIMLTEANTLVAL